MDITVYSTPTCPYCATLKEFLKKNEIEFEDVDVAADRSWAKEMIRKSGQTGVPVIDIDGEVVVGFNKKKISGLLNIDG